MRNILSTLVIASLLVIFSDAQTFQYSRGWTNGKRTAPTEPLALANSVLLPSHFAPSGMDKPSDKLLLQRLLKSPCDVRLVAALVSRNKDLLQQILAASDLDVSGSGAMFEGGVNGDGSVASGGAEDGRYKRDTRGRF